MSAWLAASPWLRLLWISVALFVIFFLVRLMVRPVFNLLKFVLALTLVVVGLFVVFDYTGFLGTAKSDGADFSKEAEDDQSTRRQIYAQIVDEEEKDKFAERPILEGRPFKYLLKRVSTMPNADVRKAVDDRTILENLADEPDLHRGEAYAAGRGVVVEISEAELTPDYGFPKGWTVLPAVFINTAREVYALRILCPPGSELYKKLKKGIDEDKLPVMNMAGLFFKNYARRTGDAKQPPWVRPLLVCPEPVFPANEEPRQVLKEIAEAGYGHLLPSKRIDAPSVDERLIVDLVLDKDGAKLRAWGADAGADTNGFIATATDKLKKRLPAEEAAKPAAVILLKGGLPADPRVEKVRVALKAVGVERVCVKQEVVNPINPNSAPTGK